MSRPSEACALMTITASCRIGLEQLHHHRSHMEAAFRLLATSGSPITSAGCQRLSNQYVLI